MRSFGNLIRVWCLTALCVPLLVVSLELLGFWAPISGQFQDFIVRTDFYRSNYRAYVKRPAVLLVQVLESQETRPFEESFATLQKQLQALGARQVLQISASEFEDTQLVAVAGVYRSYLVSPELKSLVGESSPDGAFSVNFGLGLEGLPKLEYASGSDGQLIQELVQDRTVLVAEGRESQWGLITPVSPAGAMNGLEYHGHAFNTWLKRSWLQELSVLQLCLLMLLTSVLGLCLYVPGRARYLLGGAFLMLLALSGLSLAALVYWFYVIPLVPLLMNQVGILLVVCLCRLGWVTQLLANLRVESEARLSQHYWPKSATADDGFWEQLCKSVQAVLPLKNILYYQAQSECDGFIQRYCLHPVADCPPYVSNGVERRVLVNGVGRGFSFTELAPECAGLAVASVWPLRFGGNILGLLVLHIDEGVIEQAELVDDLIPRLIASIATTLAGYWSKGAAVNTLWFRSSEFNDFTEVMRSFGEVKKRVRNLEELVEGAGSAIIIFDVLGQVLFVNKQMRSLVVGEAFAIYEVKLDVFIAQVSGLEAAAQKALLRAVLLQRTEMSIPVNFVDRPRSHFSMRLAVLDLANSYLEQEVAQAGGLAVICEVADVSDYSQLSELKGLLSQRLGVQIRNDLNVIEMCASLLARADLDPGKRSEVLGRVEGKVSSLARTIAECEQYWSLDDSWQNGDQYPVDCKSLLSRAVAEVSESAAERGVELRVTQPSILSYAVASTAGLEDVFESVLRVLVSDATDNGVVATEVIELEDCIIHAMSNSGFGIPVDRLKGYVFGSEPLSAPEFQRLRRAAQLVQAWGGEFEVGSELGEGMRFSVRLPRFL